jgi:hypothetical protein
MPSRTQTIIWGEVMLNKDYAIDTWRKYANRNCEHKRPRNSNCRHRNHAGFDCLQSQCPRRKLIEKRIIASKHTDRKMTALRKKYISKMGGMAGDPVSWSDLELEFPQAMKIIKGVKP